jgi:hypothetical protein
VTEGCCWNGVHHSVRRQYAYGIGGMSRIARLISGVASPSKYLREVMSGARVENYRKEDCFVGGETAHTYIQVHINFGLKTSKPPEADF